MFCQACSDHSILKLFKGRLLINLQLLQDLNEFFFFSFKLLGLFFKLVDHAFLLLNLFLSFCFGLHLLEVLEGFYILTTWLNHVSDCFSLLVLSHIIKIVKLLLSHVVLSQLIFDCLDTFSLLIVHAILCILNLISSCLLLFIDQLILKFLSSSLFRCQLLLQVSLIVPFSEIDKLISLLRCLLYLLLSFFMLLLKHSDSVPQQFYIVLDLIFHAFNFICWGIIHLNDTVSSLVVVENITLFVVPTHRIIL